MAKKGSELQTVDYNQLGPREVRVLDIWGRGIVKLPDIVNEYNSTFAQVDGVAKVRAVDVSQCIKKIKRIVLNESFTDLQEIVQEETMQLYREAKEAWQESKEDQVVITETREESDKGFKDSTSEKRSAQTGNPAHWANAMRALDNIAKLMGLGVPTNVNTLLREHSILLVDFLEQTISQNAFAEVVRALANYSDDNVVDIEVEEIEEL